MAWKSRPLPDGSYADAVRPYTSQDLINYIPEFAENQQSRGAVKLVDAPGLQEFASMGTGFRGAVVVAGIFYGVSGTTLYKCTTTGAVTALGTIPGSTRCSLSFNQIAGGNQILIVNGQSGYIFDNVALTLTKITSANFPGGIIGVFIGQYFVTIDPSRRDFRNSSLTDGLTWNGLETYEDETSPDLLMSLAVNHNELVVFSEATVGIFKNVGTTNALFQNTGNSIPYGCGATHGVVVIDSSTMFVGSDRSIYQIQGYTATRISTHAIEQSLAGQDISKCWAFTHEEFGHKIAYFCFPSITWGYDCATQKWHRRRSYGSDAWRLATLNFWNGRWFGGDAKGRLYRVDWDYMFEACEEHVREWSTGVAHDSGNRMRWDAIRIEVDTGGADSVCGGVFVLSIAGNAPNAVALTAYSYAYSVTGGDAPCTFSISAGSLPAGITLNATTGVLTGAGTTSGTSTFTVRVTDSTGATATVADTIQITAVAPAQYAGWRYFLTTLADATARQGTAYDDSAWLVGAAPFGNLVNNAVVGTNATAYDSRFKSTINTNSPLDNTVWFRRHLTLATVPVGGFTMTGFFDNGYSVYVNGTLRASGTTTTNAGVSANIPAAAFVVGDNVIAVRGDDDAGTSGIDACYFDFIFDPVP